MAISLQRGLRSGKSKTTQESSRNELSSIEVRYHPKAPVIPINKATIAVTLIKIKASNPKTEPMRNRI